MGKAAAAAAVAGKNQELKIGEANSSRVQI